MDFILQLTKWGFSSVDVALAALLIFGSVFFFVVRGGSRNRFNIKPEDAFDALPSAWPSIVILWASMSLAIRLGSFFLPSANLKSLRLVISSDPEKTLFMTYLVGFIALWVVYFLSRVEQPFFKTRTLRRLLMMHTYNCQSRLTNPSEAPADFEEIQQKKANSSVQALSILAASAAVLISLSADKETLLLPYDVVMWRKFMLLLSVSTAVLAFYCFLIAVDILDTAFNTFRHDIKVKLLKNLYGLSVNPKYFGLILLMLSLAFYVASSQPGLGALALAAATFTGYSHWFPRIKPRSGVQQLEWLLRVILLVIPATVMFASM